MCITLFHLLFEMNPGVAGPVPASLEWKISVTIAPAEVLIDLF